MKVLVVGAGPAGVATALLLARFGVDVRLVERERSFARVFRGVGLMPWGIDALFEMRLGGVFKTVPGRRVDSWDIWIDGEEVFVIPEPVEELGERAMRVVSQPALLEKLVEEASWSFENSNASQRHLQCPWPKIILKAPDNPESHERGGFARGRTQHAQG